MWLLLTRCHEHMCIHSLAMAELSYTVHTGERL